MFRRRFMVCAAICVVGYAAQAEAEVIFSMRPVGATTAHSINGNDISIQDVPSRVTLEIYVQGWDPDGDGDPRIHLYETRIDSSGYASGSAGALSPALLPCDSDGDCFAVSECEASGFCDPYGSIYGDLLHPAYIFAGLNSFTVADVNTFNPDYRIAGLIVTAGVGVTDLGTPRYLGTLLLDVPSDADGTFTVSVSSDPDRTFLGDTDNNQIGPTAVVPAQITVVRDCNQNGTPDDEDIAGGESEDCNGNGRPDECEPDCNANGTADSCDITSGSSGDCNSNGIPDECDPDCNENGVADECEGGTTDCNENGIPDVCETGFDQDCNENGQPDLCDLFNGVDSDCNQNAAPDDCDVSSGVSADCDGNGEPDECQLDCNRNGLADPCDILLGYSTDVNADGRPDDCFRGLGLKPVGSTIPHRRILGHEITVLIGGGQVFLELQMAGWDPVLDGSPALGLYTAEIDSASFGGVLSIGGLPCQSSDDCYLSAACLPSGVCTATSAAYIESAHPNFVFAGFQPFMGVTFADPDVDFGSFVTGLGVGAADPGHAAYGGTLILDVPPDATGTYSIGFTEDTGLSDAFNSAIPGTADRVPAVIRINSDCDDNGVYDGDDLAAGTLTDANGNGAPDECEFGVPGIGPEAARYLTITPQPGPGSVALRVTSEQFPCLERYVNLLGNGRPVLTDTPQFLFWSNWGTVSVADAALVPGAMYSVEAVYPDLSSSLVASAATAEWGDVGPPWGLVDFLDVSRTVDRFKHLPTAPPVERTDFAPAVPNGIVDFGDISVTVNAFKSLRYPYGMPCP